MVYIGDNQVIDPDYNWLINGSSISLVDYNEQVFNPLKRRETLTVYKRESTSEIEHLTK